VLSDESRQANPAGSVFRADVVRRHADGRRDDEQLHIGRTRLIVALWAGVVLLAAGLLAVAVSVAGRIR
jgi:hypothetical protein